MEKDWRVVFGGIEKTGRHLNEGLFFGMILKGEILLEQSLNATSMPADSCFVIGDGEVYGMESKEANLFLGIRVRAAYLERECPEMAFHAISCNSVHAGKGLEQPFAELKKGIVQMVFLYLGKKEGWQFLFRAELWRVLGCLYRNFSRQEAEKREENEKRLSAVLEFIRRNYRRKISLNELAEKEFFSTAYLSRWFHREMGVSFTKYLSSLRLERSVRELLDTDHTILEIALNHGFANVKAYNRRFKETYQDTPASYRKKAGRLGGEEEWFYLPESAKKETMEVLVQYLKTYSQDSGKGFAFRETIDAGQREEKAVWQSAKILNIGSMAQALRHDVRCQLMEVHKKLRFQYVYLWKFVSDSYETIGYNNYLQFSDYYDLFDTIYAGGWQPFLRIEIDELLDSSHFGGLEEALVYLKNLLERLLWKYERIWWNHWKFDIAGTSAQLEESYSRICAAIHEVLDGVEIGVCLGTLEEVKWEEQDRFLKDRVPKREVAFLTFAMDQNWEKEKQKEDRGFETHSKALIGILREFMREIGGGDVRYYLLDWNVLAGGDHITNGEFHRSALLVDQLLKNMPLADGLGFRLNLFVPSVEERSLYATYFPSLFLYRQIKRPSFFICWMLEMCRERVLHLSNRLVATWDGEDGYTMLLFNPKYIEPEEVLGDIVREIYKDTFEITLQDFRPGHYRIRKMTLDKEHGSIYHGMRGIDKTRSLNVGEVDEYLENTTFPDVTIYETDIDGVYRIHQNLLLNAVVFYTLKRLY